ncbi:MAG: lytic transglycosylase F [Acidobacteria bacterium]|nr:MAG: lytic transglycosylase F [Acidobacteriota bacterium]
MRIRRVRYRIDVRTKEKILLPESGRKTLKKSPLYIVGLCLICVTALLAFRFIGKSEKNIQGATFKQTPLKETALKEASVLSTPQEEPEDRKISDEPELPEEIPLELKGSHFLQTWKGDLDGMAKRRVIRALVVYSKTLYFLDGAQQRGISYEMLHRFEDYINASFKTKNLRIHVVFIPVARDELLPALAEGRGDVAAANLTITKERRKLVDFSDPLITGVNEWIVTGPQSPKIKTIDDLSGKEIYVRKSSSYFESMQRLNESFLKEGKAAIQIMPVNEALETEDILEMVNAGIYPITVVDSSLGEYWSRIFRRLQMHRNIAINQGGQIGWAFRKNSPRLRKAINRFVKDHRKGTKFGNVLFAKYFQSSDWIKNNLATQEQKKFNRCVGVFQKYAHLYDFNYLMVTAQAFQESRLDQSVVSRSGAIGILQILPTTAKDPNVNVTNIGVLDNNVRAGVKYMRFMMDYYFKNAPMDELNKNLFAFASYNAGPNRIAALRKKAVAMKLNPNVWFGNVEVVASREIGRETVQYVSNIMKYYLAYTQIQTRQQERQIARAS